MSAPVPTIIAYAFKRRHGPHKVVCKYCCGDETPSLALEVRDTDDDRERFGCPTDEDHVILCEACGERLA